MRPSKIWKSPRPVSYTHLFFIEEITVCIGNSVPAERDLIPGGSYGKHGSCQGDGSVASGSIGIAITASVSGITAISGFFFHNFKSDRLAGKKSIFSGDGNAGRSGSHIVGQGERVIFSFCEGPAIISLSLIHI